jgi:hypothetical protein
MKTVRDHVNDEFNKTGRYYNEIPYERKSKDPVKWEAYVKREAEIHDNFIADLEKEFDTDVYPEKVRSLIFAKAWEEGHAYGHSEVLNCYQKLAGFVENILLAMPEL